MGSMVPMGGGSSGLVKLRSGWLGRTQAVGMVRPLAAWASSAEATTAAGAPGTGPTPGPCSTSEAEEPGRRGGACCGGGCCWRRGLTEASDDIATEEGGGERWSQRKIHTEENKCVNIRGLYCFYSSCKYRLHGSFDRVFDYMWKFTCLYV